MFLRVGADSVKLYEAVVNSWDTCPEEDAKIIKDMLINKHEYGIGKEMQSMEDVAKMIEEVIISSKPDFRYQTSQTAKRLASNRFVDPTGNAAIDSWQ